MIDWIVLNDLLRRPEVRDEVRRLMQQNDSYEACERLAIELGHWLPENLPDEERRGIEAVFWYGVAATLIPIHPHYAYKDRIGQLDREVCQGWNYEPLYPEPTP